MPVGDRLEQGFHRTLIADIGGDMIGLTAAGPDFIGDRGPRRGIDLGDTDQRTDLGQAERDRPADAAPRAGDDRDIAVEFERIRARLPPLFRPSVVRCFLAAASVGGHSVGVKAGWSGSPRHRPHSIICMKTRSSQRSNFQPTSRNTPTSTKPKRACSRLLAALPASMPASMVR